MLVATLRFPLGVYHALGVDSGSQPDCRHPEWPPSPVRLIGALLDAAHGQPGGATHAALEAIQTLAAAGAPTIQAPSAAEVPASSQEVAVLAGPSRWAPRSAGLAELKEGMSLRDLAGPRAAVDKGGVAIGDTPVAFVWPDLTIDEEQRRELGALAADVSWLGTSRSPVLVTLSSEPLVAVPAADVWEPLTENDAREVDATLRVPHAATIDAFDAEFARRRSGKGKVERSGLQKPASAGHPLGYGRRATKPVSIHDPQQWGHAYVLEVSPESPERPRATATYLVARAVRAALLDQFARVGADGDAPELLRGRGATPHAAIVPLPFVGATHADGLIKGVAVLLPHPQRLDGDLTEVADVEHAIRRLVDHGVDGEPGRVRLVGTSGMVLRETVPVGRPLRSLDLGRYQEPSKVWTTVTPVVHSRWQAAKSDQALVDQVAADCAHVGLPAPSRVEVLRNPALRGAPPSRLDRRGLRRDWQGPIDGPAAHLRLSFPMKVRGPLLLGKARHFGLGLMLPEDGGAPA